MMVENFTITENHLKLLQNMYVEFDYSAYDGAPAVDIKRPYGDSGHVSYHVYRILYGKDWWDDNPDSDEMNDDLYDKLYILHQDTAIVLQICLVTQKFETGDYVITRKYDSLSWKKVK